MNRLCQRNPPAYRPAEPSKDSAPPPGGRFFNRNQLAGSKLLPDVPRPRANMPQRGNLKQSRASSLQANAALGKRPHQMIWSPEGATEGAPDEVRGRL